MKRSLQKIMTQCCSRIISHMYIQLSLTCQYTGSGIFTKNFHIHMFISSFMSFYNGLLILVHKCDIFVCSKKVEYYIPIPESKCFTLDIYKVFITKLTESFK